MIHSPHDEARATVTEHFSVTYDGPALAEHRMPVTDLAPALMALSEMFMAAHRVASDGVSPPPALEVRANREGSFAVELVLSPNEIVDLLNHQTAVASATGLTLLQPVVNALRWLQHRRRSGIEPTVETLEPGTLRVHWPDGTVIEAPASSEALVRDMDFRRTAKGALAPLTQDTGIDTVQITPERESAALEGVILDREDARYLDRPPEDDRVVSDTTRIVGLNPLKPSFEKGLKWWVSDGSSKFWVTMHDLDFIQRVEASAESFTAGDILQCELRDRQIQDDDGSLKMDHTVMRVIRHLRRPPPDPFEMIMDPG